VDEEALDQGGAGGILIADFGLQIGKPPERFGSGGFFVGKMVRNRILRAVFETRKRC
jgi:hypothetical protein